jgi:signal transduction histidine kinase
MASFNEMGSKRQVTDFHIRSLHRDGRYMHINASVRLVERRDGNVSMVCIIKDVTDLILSRQQIEKEKSRAEFYLDLLSHDIGNIHQGLQLWTTIARSRGSDDAARERALTRMEELEKRSIKLVKNVLLLSRLKDMKEEFSDQDLVPLIENAMNETKGLFAQKDIRMNFSHQVDSAVISAEPVIEEVFFNLIHNGLKFQYSDPALIDIELARDERGITVQISDHGLGISDEKKAHLFDRHIKGSDFGYSGIGLSLVKELITRYNGALEVRDRLEGDHRQGARFVIWFPAAGAGVRGP